MLGEWSDNLNAFWMGANNMEFIAWKGSHNIAVYPCDDYPNLPTLFVQGDRRIESVEDFDYVLRNGEGFAPNYEKTDCWWQFKSYTKGEF